MLREMLVDTLKAAVEKGRQEGVFPTDSEPGYELDVPRQAGHGDFCTNLALTWAKAAGRKPRDLAAQVVERLDVHPSLVSKVEIAGPGFINFHLGPAARHEVLRKVLDLGPRYGRSEEDRGRFQVEFVSANPVGPLHVGHGRWAAVGDSLARVLEAAGWRVEREFYINDRGVQMRNFGHSLWVRLQQAAGQDVELSPDDYRGEYLAEMAARYLEEGGRERLDDEEEAIAWLVERGYADMMECIREVLGRARVHFDSYFSEREMHRRGEVEAVLRRLREAGAVHEKEGATWFAASRYGEPEDKVLIKSNREYTYFLTDIAYHADKFERGFDRCLDIWGADHAGHVGRMKAAMEALGYSRDRLEIVIGQHVHLMAAKLDDQGNPVLDEQGAPVKEQVKMSKRTGRFYTFEDLLEEFGADVVRFFFLQRSTNSTLEFDLDLAAEQSEKNPVFRIQYAHARISSLQRMAADLGVSLPLEAAAADLSALTEPAEIDLIGRMEQLPSLVATAAERREPHHIPYYALELAGSFHTFYNQHRILGEAPAVTQGRLALALGVKAVLAACCALMGVEAPDRM